jgi:hypothetical protein
MNRISRNQSRYVNFVSSNPGCCIADVDRACRHNPQAGHRWVYDGVSRLIHRGLLKAYRDGSRKMLYTPEAYAAMSASLAS